MKSSTLLENLIPHLFFYVYLFYNHFYVLVTRKNLHRTEIFVNVMALKALKMEKGFVYKNVPYW